MKNSIIVIPAYNPLQTLNTYIDELLQLQPQKIIIVNDGSDKKFKRLFNQLNEKERCLVLEYDQNVGKGHAIKTAIKYILANEKYFDGIVMTGADGQHKLEDVHLIKETKGLFSDGLIIGVRQFRHRELPISSFIGNRAATILFELLFHKRLLDIQSGLRYIPRNELYWIKNVPGKRFNFDTNMLIEAIARHVPIYEVPIGEAKIKRNSFTYYDEIFNAKVILKHIWHSYRKNRF